MRQLWKALSLFQTYTAGYDLLSFLRDRKTQDAVIRNLEIIGQALKDFGVDVLSEIEPKMPWREIAGMRNVLAHEYLGVDMEMVWNTVQCHLDPLQRSLEALMEGFDGTW